MKVPTRLSGRHATHAEVEFISRSTISAASSTTSSSLHQLASNILKSSRRVCAWLATEPMRVLRHVALPRGREHARVEVPQVTS